MKDRKYLSQERGTLLVEAIAMLGLIAMVTPTLYQKSAERLQEIQDINTASQARTMNTIVETFLKANFSEVMAAASTTANETIELIYDDDNVGCPAGAVCFHKGYSAYVPFGYTPGSLKNYGEPRVYVHRDLATGKETLMSYVVYPTNVDVGKKRAARIASLVGANGGTMTTPLAGGSSLEIFGTGGAWYLDNSAMVNMVGIEEDMMIDNSLVVASNEPVAMSDMDSEKFLYRVPADDGNNFHNQMVTDLYMGGHIDETSWSDHAQEKFYSIFNVRKLTMNTRCTRAHIAPGGSANADCDPRISEVADLYIGKPTMDGFNSANVSYSPGVGSHNTGAAWFYGNLSALNRNFRLFREDDDSWDRQSGYDVMEFARMDGEEESSQVDFSVFRAQNLEGSAKVSMLDDFVVIREGDSSATGYEFLVGNAKDGGENGSEGSWIHAYRDGSVHALRLNSPDELESLNPEDIETWINAKGGVVHINGGSSNADYRMDTLINDQGGNLEAGKSGGWLKAAGKEYSSVVYLLNGKDISSSGVGGLGDQRVFAVGTDTENSNYMIRGVGGGKVGLRNGLFRVFNVSGNATMDSSGIGGSVMLGTLEGTANVGTGEAIRVDPQGKLIGATGILSRYTDILGSTYMGMGEMQPSSGGVDDGSIYSRGAWTLGVAGSAWVDQLLWARRAWFNEFGSHELHAGFSSFADYKENPNAGWLNVYDDAVIVRNPALAKANNEADLRGGSSDIMFSVDSSQIFMRVQDAGSWAQLTPDAARFGTVNNRLWAEENTVTGGNSINLTGSTLANIYTDDSSAAGMVNIQNDAMVFAGHPFEDSSYVAVQAGDFRLHTRNENGGIEEAELYADSTHIRMRDIDFHVENDESSVIFKVMPGVTTENSSDANVMVDGSFHVKGNDVIHVASNTYNRAEDGKDEHAMLEVDPEYIQVWAKNTGVSGDYAKNGEDYYALVKIDPYDVSGSSTSDIDHNASVYIRRGAIELEPNTSSSVDGGWAADEGYGYILANRLVSNAEGADFPSGYDYDQYMVNPAYTSVMHDIKLTTRGGARLSDVLPDYVLKGVYNLINNRLETNANSEATDNGAWAHPYIGVVPYALCPPGYRNMATVIPISFSMGQAGQLVKETKDGGGERYVINNRPQSDILNRTAGNIDKIIYPGFEDVSTVVYNEVYSNDHTFSSFISNTYSRSEGWFLGFPTVYSDSSWTNRISDFSSLADGTGWRYSDGEAGYKEVATPLYFQQNTWLKTVVDPKETGWDAYMGFLYDTGYWSTTLGGVDAPVKSNYNVQGYNDTSATGSGTEMTGYVWNLFPVPTNTLEGHATVYCYFDRSNFTAWGDKVDQVDQLNNYRAIGDVSTSGDDSSAAYRRRLQDPTLKYNDPW